MQIQINGKDAADAWVERARGLNEETEGLLKDVSNLLTSVRNFSEGTLVDEIVELGIVPPVAEWTKMNPNL